MTVSEGNFFNYASEQTIKNVQTLIISGFNWTQNCHLNIKSTFPNSVYPTKDLWLQMDGIAVNGPIIV